MINKDSERWYWKIHFDTWDNGKNLLIVEENAKKYVKCFAVCLTRIVYDYIAEKGTNPITTKNSACIYLIESCDRT